ncbi:MAG: type II secretion system F family protein [Gemmataceae bacterium]|nr:type II secretion system F family protein [Gemmataceae bacterium]
MGLIELLSLAVLTAGLAGLIAYYQRVVRPRELARARLAATLDLEGPAPPRVQVFVRKRWWLPWLVALAVGGAVVLLTPLPRALGSAFGVVAGLLAWQGELGRLARRRLQMESQLADAIDLMVGALHAGGSALSALEHATREARAPLRPQLEEVLGRIRLGDDPQEVFQALAARVPLETFRLFVSVLAVHWEVGGSLAPALASVGRAVRDRIELSRRVRALTAETRVSLVAVLAMTYFIALIIWANEPERMQAFLATTVGTALTTGAVLLQGLGVVWASSLSRMKL